jgi:hypothetical protein
MVLVDSSHEGQASRGAHGWPYGRSRYLRRAMQRQARILGVRRLAAAVGLLRQLDTDIAREVPPDHAAAYRASLLSTRQRRVVVREILMMARLSEEPPSLGAVPLNVITAGARPIPGWREMQDELAAISSTSRLRGAGTTSTWTTRS